MDRLNYNDDFDPKVMNKMGPQPSMVMRKDGAFELEGRNQDYDNDLFEY